MAVHEITVEGGSSTRLLTAGKYCDRDIVVTATGGGGKIAVGTFTPTLDSTSYTVSGLPFKPTFVEVMAMHDSNIVNYAGSATSSNNLFLGAKCGTLGGVSFDDCILSPTATTKMFYGSVYTLSNASIAFTDDGFKLSLTGVRKTYFIDTPHSYIAIG